MAAKAKRNGHLPPREKKSQPNDIAPFAAETRSRSRKLSVGGRFGLFPGKSGTDIPHSKTLRAHCRRRRTGRFWTACAPAPLSTGDRPLQVSPVEKYALTIVFASRQDSFFHLLLIKCYETSILDSGFCSRRGGLFSNGPGRG